MFKSIKTFSSMLLLGVCAIQAENVSISDSFDQENTLWSSTTGYTRNSGKSLALSAQNTQGNPLRLNKGLPSICQISFYLKMPEVNALGGFTISQRLDELVEHVNFTISGQKSETKKELKGTKIIRQANGIIVGTLMNSAMEIGDTQWKRIDILRDFSNFEILFDGHSIGNFQLQGEPVHFALWADSDKEVLFDEFNLKESRYLSKDFTGKDPGFGNFYSKNWTIASGAWSKIYLPSLDCTALSQSSKNKGRIHLNEVRKDDYEFSCKVKSEEDGEFGLILDEKDNENHILVSIKTGEKSSLTARRRIGGAQEKVFGKSSLPLYRGIWYDLKVVCRANQYQVFLNQDPMFQFQLPVVTKGKLGLHTEGSSTTLFKDPVISEPDYNFPLVTCKKLDFKQIEAEGWDKGRILSIKTKSSKVNKISFKNHVPNNGSVFSGSVKGEKSFNRFYLHLAGIDSTYEFNVVNYKDRYFAVVLYKDESVKASPVKDSVANLYLDERNKEMKEVYRQALTDFDPKAGIPFAIGMNHQVNLSINGKSVFEQTVAGDGSFFIEAGGVGNFEIHNADLHTPIHSSKEGSRADNIYQFEKLKGDWTIRGGILDHQSMPKGSDITLKPFLIQHGKVDVFFNTQEDKGAKFKVKLINPSTGKPQFSINLDYSDGKTVSLKARNGQESIEGKSPIEGKFKFTLAKSGHQFTFYVNDKVIGEMFRREPALSQLQLNYLSGSFLISDIQLKQQPSHYSLFENHQRYVRDIELWDFNESFNLISNGKQMGEIKKVNKQQPSLQFPLTRVLPSRFILHTKLDYSRALNVRHDFIFNHDGQKHTLSLSPGGEGCQLKIQRGDDKATNAIITGRSFALTIFKNGKSMSIFADNKLISKVDANSKECKLLMQMVGQDNMPIAISQFALFTDI